VSLEPGYVAYGGSWDIDVRTSTDAATWIVAEEVEDGVRRDEPSGDVAPGTYGAIHGVAFGAGRYVAVGGVRDISTTDGELGISSYRPGFWTSLDGSTWTRLPDADELLGRPYEEVFNVVYGDDGFVAVGNGGVWQSPDGLAWNRVPGTARYDLDGVIHGDAGYVAIGSSHSLLVSSDGMTWDQPTPDGITDGVRFNDIAYGDGVYVIVGSEEYPAADDSSPDDAASRLSRAGVWYSTDGLSWSRVTHDNLDQYDLHTFGGYPGPASVAFHDGRFVAVGYQQWVDAASGQPIYRGHVWIGVAS
jgi:hypothetical protein